MYNFLRLYSTQWGRGFPLNSDYCLPNFLHLAPPAPNAITDGWAPNRPLLRELTAVRLPVALARLKRGREGGVRGKRKYPNVIEALTKLLGRTTAVMLYLYRISLFIPISMTQSITNPVTACMKSTHRLQTIIFPAAFDVRWHVVAYNSEL